MADVYSRHDIRIALHLTRTMPVMILQAVAAYLHYMSPDDAIRAVLAMAATSSVGGKTRSAALAAIVFSMRVVVTRSDAPLLVAHIPAAPIASAGGTGCDPTVDGGDCHRNLSRLIR